MIIPRSLVTQRDAISSLPETSSASPRIPPWMIPLIHSYSRDMAGVVRMRSVKGGSNLRTSRGSSGVRVANWKSVNRRFREPGFCTYQLDQLDGHPIITAIYKKLKQSRSQRQEVIRPPPAKLTHDVDDSSGDAWVLIWCHQTFLDLWPCGSESLWVYQC